MEMGFNVDDGKIVILRIMSNGDPRIVLSSQVDPLFNHGDVSYDVECLIMNKKSSNNNQLCHVDIQSLLRKHDMGFWSNSSKEAS